MATESITHHFCFEGEAAERFINAIEEAWDGPRLSELCEDVGPMELHGEELKKFIERTIKANVKR